MILYSKAISQFWKVFFCVFQKIFKFLFIFAQGIYQKMDNTQELVNRFTE